MSLTSLRGGSQIEQRKEKERMGEVAGDGRIAAAAERFLTASRARRLVAGDAVADDPTGDPVG
jgi:hypothetical protein